MRRTIQLTLAPFVKMVEVDSDTFILAGSVPLTYFDEMRMVAHWTL